MFLCVYVLGNRDATTVVVSNNYVAWDILQGILQCDHYYSLSRKLTAQCDFTVGIYDSSSVKCLKVMTYM